MAPAPTINDPYHYREFLAYLHIKKNPYYPGPHFYGTGLTRREVMRAWEGTRRSIRLGRAPDSLFVYVHLPFCACHCYFCQTINIGLGRDRRIIPLYLKTLYEEMSAFSGVLRGLKVTTVYFGGGTPGLMTPAEIEETLAHLRKNFSFGPHSRFIFESSPSTLDFRKLDALKKLGVYELDLGIESFDDGLLKKNARPQTMRRTIEIIRYAKKIGIPSLACDLMVGMPHQTPASAFQTLALAARLPIDGIYICPFIPNQNTRFSREGQVYSPEQIGKRNKVKLIADRFLVHSGFKMTLNGLRKNWTERNKRHAYAGQETSNLLGFGHGACSRAINTLRYTQVLKDLLPLEKAWSAPKAAARAKETLPNDKILERFERPPLDGGPAFAYSGIRMDEKKEMHVYAYTNIYGLSLKTFKNKFHVDFTEAFKEELELLTAHRNLCIHRGKVVFLNENCVSNKVIRIFFMDKEYTRTIAAADKETYDPKKDYRALIAPLAV